MATHSNILACISPSNEHPGLISFRMDCLDLLAVQRTLKSLLQHHSAKASIFQPLALFTVQLPHPYITTGKTIALTRWTFVGKVPSLLFNMLSRLVITFLLRSRHLLISWLQSPYAVILDSPKIKSATFPTVSLSICHQVMGPDAMILIFWMLSFKPTFSLSSFTFITKITLPSPTPDLQYTQCIPPLQCSEFSLGLYHIGMIDFPFDWSQSLFPPHVNWYQISKSHPKLNWWYDSEPLLPKHSITIWLAQRPQIKITPVKHAITKV